MASGATEGPDVQRGMVSRLLCSEPASWTIVDGQRRCRWIAPVSIYFSSEAPVCSTCGEFVEWLGPPQIKGDVYRYFVKCGCGNDVIETFYRLVMGGTAAWWLSRGWGGGELKKIVMGEDR